MNVRRYLPIALVPAVLVAAGCGGGKHAASTASTQARTQTRTQSATTQQSSGSPGALQAEAASAATGDIPDNQVFLVYDSPARWAIKYPEGWARSGGSTATVFRDKNNIVRVVARKGLLPTPAQVRSDPSLRRAHITTPPTSLTIGGTPALKVVYTTTSAPSPVTGKHVTLTVDRYYLTHGGGLAVVDLGTPVGVDNVDAYRLMIHSFRWR